MADAAAISGRRLFILRLGIGLAQGLALYLLYRAQDGQDRTWPATDGAVFAPLLLCWIFIPLLLASALGEMRRSRAVLWSVIAAFVLAILAYYDNWSAWPQDWVFAKDANSWRPHILPSAPLFFFGGAGLFIAHALVVGGHADGRFMATYTRHFDVAWKLAVQLALTGLFVAVFWALLWLGAGLFNLIKLDFFQKLITHEWFAIPATALAAAGALHLTDIRPALVRGARTLLLTLLSWLLPLLALIVAGFVASLPVTGLAALWNIGHASALLLAASAVLIILINTTHQDGEPDRQPPQILRWAGSLAAILPLPLSLIAAYALWLRIQQYGWTVDRVLVAACVIVAVSYAVGYVAAIFPRDPWLKRIETWNFYVALLILAVLLALFTPLANPKRIAVADQMARLENGRIAPEKFDVHFLRWQGGRYGQRALAALEQSKTALLRQMAQAAESQTNQYDFTPGIPALIGTHMIVYPHGATVPRSFLQRNWNFPTDKASRDCLEGTAVPCELLLADLDGAGQQDIVVFSKQTYGAEVFSAGANGVWSLVGSIIYPYNCPAVLDAFRLGHLQTATPLHKWNDIVLGGIRFPVRDAFDSTPISCPKEQ